MDELPTRPDPDALLRRVQDEDERSKRGKLKIFFGFAPGVGKTYRMLQAARELIGDQKSDVVAGVVETHRRAETTTLLLGIELLPRLQVQYKGSVLREFDLDAALARKPELLLLDELAHTNAPGCRHAKRWQDAQELLDAGINVYTTLNVQHLESLNDVVAQITHIQVRETVPDSILERADEIELVDIAPEELLERLREGKVYLPEEARRAADHFFRRGNLLALRELALRQTAQHVDEDVQKYREEHGVAATWPTAERILVCVGVAPSSARLIRAAARMAAGLRCPWVAAYVDVGGPESASGADRDRLEAHLRLAETLGATVTRLASVHAADALLSYARKHNVTRIVIGKPVRFRKRDIWRKTLLSEVIRGSGDIEIHLLGILVGEDGASRQEAGVRSKLAMAPYAWVIGLVVLTTLVAGLLRRVIFVPDLEVLYFLAVLLAAVRLGRGPAILASALGVLAYDFFFVPPPLTLNVHDARYFMTFGMLFAIGFVVSELASRLRRQEREAIAREERTAALYALSKALISADDAIDVATVAANQAAEVFAVTAIAFHSGDGDALEPAAAFPLGSSLDGHELAVAKWCYRHSRPAGLGTDTLPGSSVLCAPLLGASGCMGVLALRPTARQALSIDLRALLDAFCHQVGFALERVRLAREARQSAVRVRTEEMRNSLLSAVSHDLRTPLAAMTGAATSLRDDTNLGEATKAELLESICEEAERLERLVANLLEMTRLESGPVALKLDWVPVEEVIGSALTRMERRLGTRRVDIRCPNSASMLHVDPVLIEQVFLNLFENAVKYTGPDSAIEVDVVEQAKAVMIDVKDRGPGLPAGVAERIFDKFFRGAHPGVGGVGLGLSICRGIVQAHGGSIEAFNRAEGGAVFRVTLPIDGQAPLEVGG